MLTLAFCLFGMPVGHHARLPHRAADHPRASGPAHHGHGGGAGFLLSFIGPALAPNALALGLALFLCGLTIATIEVSMNAKASQTERVLGRRIMTRCHAFWSFGTVLGALIAGAFAQRGWASSTQQLVLQPLFAAATIFFALRLIPDDPAPAAEEPARGFALPSPALVADLPRADRGAPDRGRDDGVVGAADARVEGREPLRHRRDLLGLRAGDGGEPAEPATGWPSASGRGR